MYLYVYEYIHTYIYIYLSTNNKKGRACGTPLVCCVTQQTCLLCHTEGMSAVSHMSAVGHVRHACCGTRQTCLLCRTADMSAVSRNRHDCCLTQRRHVFCAMQQTCPPCHAVDMSAASHSKHVGRVAKPGTDVDMHRRGRGR